MKMRNSIILLSVVATMALLVGFGGGYLWRVQETVGWFEELLHDPLNSPLSVHLQLPANGKLELNQRYTSLRNVKNQVHLLAKNFNCINVRPVLHIAEATPCVSLWRVIYMLRDEGIFTFTLSWGVDGEDTYMDVPDHFCGGLQGPGLRIGTSAERYWISEPTNIVDVATVKQSITELQAVRHGHLCLVYDRDGSNVASLIELMTAAKQSGISETTLEVR